MPARHARIPRHICTLLLVGALHAHAPSLLAAAPADQHPPDPGTPIDPDRAPAVDDPANLLPNGDFNDPADNGEHPAHWQPIDNLAIFWQPDDAADNGSEDRGRVIRFNTDVNQAQAYDWWVQRFVHDAPLSEAPEREPTTPPKYDTLAGLDGVFMWSDFIEIEQGGAYRVYVDARGPPSKVFIRGYDERLERSFADEIPAVQQLFREARGEPARDDAGRPVRFRPRYRYTTWFPVGGSDQWRTYTHQQPRHPNNRIITRNVRYIRIALYAYWPPGEYHYNNVRVVPVEPDPEQARPDASEQQRRDGRVIE